jgi:hypothetical protein
MLGAFFDDSGTHAGSPVMTIGGVLGTEAQWDVFAAAWEALLKEPLPGKRPLKQFHLSPCRAGRDEFESYSPAERDHLIYLFRQVIFDTGLVTVAAAVDNTAWDDLVTRDVAEQLGHPLEFLLYKCLNSISDIVRWRKPEERTWVFFDEGIRDRVEVFAYAYLQNNKDRPEIANVGFAPVSKVIALQAGDMIATETFQFGQQWLLDRENPVTNPHFESFRWRDISAGLIFDRGAIAEMVERVKAGAPPV